MQVGSGYHGEESAFDFIVGEIQQECVEFPVIVLDGKVSALIDHRQRAFSIGLVIDELLQTIVFPGQFVHVLVEMCEQADEVGWCAGTEPIIPYALFVESIEQAERCIDIGHFLTEMVSVVLLFQHLFHFLNSAMVILCHGGDGFSEITFHFLLRDATQGFIPCVHADVIRLVESAEYADLREFGHSCE